MADRKKPTNFPSQTVCAFQPAPKGWVVDHVFTDFTKCGNIQDNMKTIKDLNGQPSGTQTDCCALLDAPVPDGWVVTGTSTDFTRCGSGNAHTDNIVHIKKT